MAPRASQGPAPGGFGPVPASAGRASWLGPALVVSAAVAIRIGVILVTPHFRLVNDAADYHRLGASIASGHGFGPSVVAAGGPTAFRPPLLPLVLGAVYRVVGVHVTAGRVAGAALGTVTVALVGLVARQFWSRRAAIIAMAIAAVYPPFLLVGGSVLSEPLAMSLELGAVVMACRARASSGRRWAWATGAGVLAGLGVLDRPSTVVVLVPLMLLAYRPATRRRFAVPAALMLSAAVTTVPWLVRDAVVMRHFVRVTTQYGLVAAGTYNDTAAHDHSYPAAWRPETLVPEYRTLLFGDEYHEEQRLRTAAVDYVRSHPAYVGRVVYWNTRRLFELAGRPVSRDAWAAIGFGPHWADGAFWGYWAVALAAALGVGLGQARRAPLALWLVPVLVWVTTAPLLGESRLRVPVDPFLILLAAAALDAAARMVRPGRHPVEPRQGSRPLSPS